MAVFHTNQARHLYVVNAYKESVSEDDDPGTTTTVFNKEGQVYFKYKGVDSLLRSDLIDINLIDKATFTPASKFGYTNKIFTLSWAHGGVGQGRLPGIKFVFHGYPSPTDADTYSKFIEIPYSAQTFEGVAYHVLKSFTDFEPKIAFYIGDKKVKKAYINSEKKYEVLYTDGTTSTDESKPPSVGYEESEWRRGVKSSKPVEFDVYIPAYVHIDNPNKDSYSYELYWVGTDWSRTPNKPSIETFVPIENKAESFPNGKLVADMEYFYTGERGDIYRGANFPYNIDTTYLVDPTKTYDSLDIHYSFVDSNESVQKSEKDITLVGNTTELNKIVSALEKQGVKINKRQ